MCARPSSKSLGTVRVSCGFKLASPILNHCGAILNCHVVVTSLFRTQLLSHLRPNSIKRTADACYLIMNLHLYEIRSFATQHIQLTFHVAILSLLSAARICDCRKGALHSGRHYAALISSALRRVVRG